MEYQFKEIEKRWQAFWAKNNTFKTEDDSIKPKYYVLEQISIKFNLLGSNLVYLV